jgi:purine-nucleoside phosphorylase
MKTTKYQQRVNDSVTFFKKWHQMAPEICIVLGSGLSDAIPEISEMKSAKYSEIPGFKAPSVLGHKGDLRIGEVKISLTNGNIKKREIAFLRGRNHGYEGNDPGEIVHNLRSLISWGVKGIILTNAAGCLNTEWELGKLMVITDHINATAMSPLNGEFGVGFGPQFVDMSSNYSKNWQKVFEDSAHSLNQKVYNGIYYGVLGSQYETPAEIKMMKVLGASAVGMSTVLETIAAKQMGAQVAAVSCLTNYGAGLKNEKLSHTDVIDMGAKFSNDIANIVLKAAVMLEV